MSESSKLIIEFDESKNVRIYFRSQWVSNWKKNSEKIERTKIEIHDWKFDDITVKTDRQITENRENDLWKPTETNIGFLCLYSWKKYEILIFCRYNIYE